MFVVSDHVVYTIDTGIKNVAIHGEAVGCLLAVWRNGATETIKVYHLICIVELEELSNTVDDL